MIVKRNVFLNQQKSVYMINSTWYILSVEKESALLNGKVILNGDANHG